VADCNHLAGRAVRPSRPRGCLVARNFLLVRLGGGSPELLADGRPAAATRERTKFAAMGGVLLTTAGVAAISMFFALHHAIGADIGWSVVLGLVWGVVILNLDRFLVVTMNDTRGRWWQMAIAVFLRLLLAALVAMVVSMPLVLQVFAGDVSSELPLIAAKKTAQFHQESLKGALAQQINHLEGQIRGEQAVISSKGSIKQQADQANVNMLTKELGIAENAKATAYNKWQCEIGGLKRGCPPGTSGLAGNGFRAKADQGYYQADAARADRLRTELNAAANALSGDETEYLRSVSSAEQELASNRRTLQELQRESTADLNKDRRENNADHDLLVQIQALFEASGRSFVLNAAHWLVTLLFFAIELLPVGVKTMLLLGPRSAYEMIAEEADRQAVDSAREKFTKRGAAEVEVAEMEAQAFIHMRKLELERDKLRREASSKIAADESFGDHFDASEQETISWYRQDVDKWPQRYIKAMLAALARL